jgi:hypothetical protein
MDLFKGTKLPVVSVEIAPNPDVSVEIAPNPEYNLAQINLIWSIR